MNKKMDKYLAVVFIIACGVSYLAGYLAKKSDIEQESRKKKTAERRGIKTNLVVEPTRNIKEALEKTKYEPHEYESMEDIPLPSFLRRVSKNDKT